MKTELKTWEGNWQREMEGAFLYGELAKLAKSSPLANTLNQMAADETRHAAVWEKHVLNAEQGGARPHIDLRIHLTLLTARLLGVQAVLSLLLNDEVSDIASYAGQAEDGGDKQIYGQVLHDETSHARQLVSLRNPKAGDHSEPWHRGVNASGILRDMIYGFNDGLTANFGLVMGVIGASVASQVIILTGFAGLLADALSMAASGFLASRSQEEVRQYHLALEKAELDMMPEEEHEELIQTFMAKGLTHEEAQPVADRLMENPEVALTQLAREELGIDPEMPVNPLAEGVRTGIATALGAIIPIIPFLFLHGVSAIWTGIAISMVMHFLIGASRAMFTGRPALRSGFEMFAVGMGVALATYFLGLLIKGK